MDEKTRAELLTLLRRSALHLIKADTSESKRSADTTTALHYLLEAIKLLESQELEK